MCTDCWRAFWHLCLREVLLSCRPISQPRNSGTISSPMKPIGIRLFQRSIKFCSETQYVLPEQPFCSIFALVSQKVSREYCSPAPSLHISTIFANYTKPFSLRQNFLKFVSFGHARLPYLQKLSMSSSKPSAPRCWRLMQ